MTYRQEWIAGLAGATITDGAFRVAIMLSTYAAHDGTRAAPAVRDLANDCNMSRRSVQRLLRTLEHCGYIRQTKPGGQGPGETTTYQLSDPAEIRS